jgi:hypothetical protein
MPLLKILVLSGVILLVGCRIQMDVPEGGSVITESGHYGCEAGLTCTVDASDVFS